MVSLHPHFFVLLHHHLLTPLYDVIEYSHHVLMSEVPYFRGHKLLLCSD